MSFVDTYIDRKRKRILVYWLTTIIVINLFDNIFLNQQFQDASTLIFTSSGSELLKTNVGATTFDAMIFLMSGIILIILLQKQKFILKITLAISIVGSIYLIFYLHSRATSSVLTVIMLILIICEKSLGSMNKAKKILLYALIVIGIFAFLSPILEYMVSLISNQRISTRLASLLNFTKGNDIAFISGDDSFGTRLYLAKTSINTFFHNLQNFIIGSGYNLKTYSSMSEMIANTGVGYHAELIDLFAIYGIIGGLIVFGILKEYARILRELFNEYSAKSQLMIVYYMFIVYSFLNLSFYSELGIVIVILLPFVPAQFKSREDISKFVK
ncbi:hypothetical protein PAECIP111891_07097 [Paenibacillus allorhizoplanae]|uniref:O-antigen ligase family protein n=2 Tax=Paenibacillus allorhizoplanae TaxID=2905648 RepID=A0ABM9D1T6_9BACL|nr:hypothetical protein PAECIP111891_07097 [Paenibacillus allorhizoplanae]